MMGSPNVSHLTSARHCQLNELNPPSSSLSPDFRAGQQARLAFSDPEPRATDSRTRPRPPKVTIPASPLLTLGMVGFRLAGLPNPPACLLRYCPPLGCERQRHRQ